MKRKQLAAGLLSILTINTSVQGAFAQTASVTNDVNLQCGLDSTSLLAVNKTLDIAVKELKDVEDGRALNVGAATALTVAAALVTLSAGQDGGLKAALIPAGVTAAAAGLGVYNFQIDSKKVAEYQAAIANLRSIVEQSKKLEDSGACRVATTGTRAERIQAMIQSLTELRGSLIEMTGELDKALKKNGTHGATLSAVGVTLAAAGLLMLVNSKTIPIHNTLFVFGAGTVLGGAGSVYSAAYNTIFSNEVPKLTADLRHQVELIDAKRAALAQALVIESKY